jgi:hypothetical protein
MMPQTSEGRYRSERNSAAIGANKFAAQLR